MPGNDHAGTSSVCCGVAETLLHETAGRERALWELSGGRRLVPEIRALSTFCSGEQPTSIEPMPIPIDPAQSRGI